MKMKQQLLAILLTLTTMTSAYASEDYVVLDINGEKVKYSQVEEVWKSLFAADEAPPLDGVDDKVRQNVLRGVVGEYLLFAKAMDSGIEKQPEIARKLEGARKKIIVDAFLEQQAAKDVTQANINAEYEKQKAGLSGEMELKASHILVDNEMKANEISAKLKNGGDFEKLAKEFSKDKGSSISGGDLGYFTKSAMVKPFSEAAFAMKVGEISAPVKSDFGWHIIKLTDKRQKAIKPLAQMQESIAQQLRTKSLHKYIDSLIDSSDIKYFDNKGKHLDFSKQLSDK
jgi:peptidyl-prolyl cis-trans isomerase C